MPDHQSMLSNAESEGGEDREGVVIWRRAREPQTSDGGDTPSRDSLPIPVDGMGALTTGTNSGSFPNPMENHRWVTRSSEEPSSSIKLSGIDYAERSSGASLEQDEEANVEVQLIATERLQRVWKRVNPRILLGDFYKHMKREAEIWAKTVDKNSFRITDEKSNISVETLKNEPIGWSRTFLVKFTN